VQPLEQGIDDLALDEDAVGAGVGRGPVQLEVAVAREGDQAQSRVLAPEVRDRRDAVHAGHVEVDDDRVGLEPLDEVDRLLTVVRDTHHGQLGLFLDQQLQRCRVALVVVREQDTNRSIVFQSVHLLPTGWMMVTALLPEGTTEGRVESHFRELRDACVQRGISLVGGHTEVTFAVNRPILVGVLIGEARGGELLRPGGARPGDRLLLTKAIALEGTALVARELSGHLRGKVDPLVVERAASLLSHPGISVVPEAMALLEAGGVTALHDPTEGGLATGVRELALAAGCGATIDRDLVPVLPETSAIASALGLDPLGMLASGSLLVAADPGAVEQLISIGTTLDFRLTRIGEVTDLAGRFTLREDGVERELPLYESDEVTRVLGGSSSP
jgi:hydrogenase expression/formation protein HypE